MNEFNIERSFKIGLLLMYKFSNTPKWRFIIFLGCRSRLTAYVAYCITMPGSKKGHAQGNWDEVDLKRAVMAVQVNRMSQKKAAHMYSIPRETLRRHLKKLGKQPELGVAKELGRKPVY